jgi:predicted ATP-dependent protease
MELTADRLAYRCDPASLGCTVSTELADLDTVIGQDRARAAIELGIEMAHEGYHVFLMGPPGSGKKALARHAIDAHCARAPAARSDWVYVNNFAQPHRPLALELPPGRGAQLRADLRRLVDDLQTTIPAVFESDEYTSQSEKISADINERGSRAMQAVVDEASSHGIATIHTPSGFTFAPQKDGQVIPPQDFEKLPEEEKERISRTIEALQEQLVRVLRNTLKLRQEHSQRIRALNRKMTLLAVEHAVDELKASYAGLPRVLEYLDAVQADVIDNADDFRRGESGSDNESDTEAVKASEFHRYMVNVLIDAGSETPVVLADLPSYQNLVGRIDHVARFGP